MIELYPQIKGFHLLMVLASGGLFALRGLFVLAGQRWPLAAPVRYLSYTIDTALLTAALMLLTLLKLNPFVVPWLGVKLLLLVGYIVLGVMALKRARTTPARIGFFVAALLCFGAMYSIARAHHPLGILARLFA